MCLKDGAGRGPLKDTEREWSDVQESRERGVSLKPTEQIQEDRGQQCKILQYVNKVENSEISLGYHTWEDMSDLKSDKDQRVNEATKGVTNSVTLKYLGLKE